MCPVLTWEAPRFPPRHPHLPFLVTPSRLSPAPGQAAEPPSALALQAFLVIDADVVPRNRDDFVLGVSSKATQLSGLCSGDRESERTRV